MKRLALLLVLSVPLLGQLPAGVTRNAYPELVGQLPPGASRTTYGNDRLMTDAPFLAATAGDTFWSATHFGATVERIEVAGDSQFLTLPANWSGTRSIATGPDGAAWFGGVGWVARVDPATNAIRRWPQGTGVSTDRILSGPDGNLWLMQGRAVVRMRPDGAVLWRRDAGLTTGAAFGTDGALYLAASDELVRLSPAGERTAVPASPRSLLFAGTGFLWSGVQNYGQPFAEIVKLSYDGEILATWQIAMTPLAADVLGNLWLRGHTEDGEVVGQLSPFGILTRYGPLPSKPEDSCFRSEYGEMRVLADGRVAMSDYYLIPARTGLDPCSGLPKPVEWRNTVTVLDPRVAPVMSVQPLSPVRRRTSRH